MAPTAPRRIEAAWARPPIPIRSADAGFAAVSGAHEIIRIGHATCLTARGSQAIVAVGDPVCDGKFNCNEFEALRRCAAINGHIPMIYKCSKRAAVAARRKGWSVVAISEDARVNPQKFDLSPSARRQLRRKLRQADRAQVDVRMASQLPLDAMADIAQCWSIRNGGERGFSMGRFSRSYVSLQRVFLAFHDGKLFAFAAFHTQANNWTLDLLRSRDGTPDGTMHALVVAAIQQAKLENTTIMSLSAMPLKGDRWPISVISKQSSGAGLRQFKQCFAPSTHTLYAAARTRSTLFIGGVDILLRVAYPDPPADKLSPSHEGTLTVAAKSTDDQPAYTRSADLPQF